jgi:hypothetical protein
LSLGRLVYRWASSSLFSRPKRPYSEVGNGLEVHMLSKSPFVAQVNYYDQRLLNVTSGRADEAAQLSQPNTVSGR